MNSDEDRYRCLLGIQPLVNEVHSIFDYQRHKTGIDLMVRMRSILYRLADMLNFGLPDAERVRMNNDERSVIIDEIQAIHNGVIETERIDNKYRVEIRRQMAHTLDRLDDLEERLQEDCLLEEGPQEDCLLEDPACS